jgi:hypothetical protein
MDAVRSRLRIGRRFHGPPVPDTPTLEEARAAAGPGAYYSVGGPDGRKLTAGSALLGPDGEVLAAARALWVAATRTAGGSG